MAEYAVALGAGHGLGVQGAATLHFINMACFVSSRGFGALFVGASALVVLRMHALSGWVGWLAVATALVELAGLAMPTTVIAQLAPMLFPLWLVAPSVVLLMRREGARLKERVTIATSP